MEKDLRDAYKALKLMRADLTRTKKDKQALEHQFTLYMQQHEAQQQHNHNHNNNHNNSNSIDADADAGMTATRRAEHALMQHEDAQAQLRQLQKEHAALQHEYEALKKEKNAGERLSNQHAHEEENQEPEPSDAVSSHAKKDATAAFEHYSNVKVERSNQDRESEFTVATEPVGSNNGEDEPHEQSHQQKQQKQLPQEETSIVEEMVREKLGLLANLYTLKTKLDEQTSEMLEQQANFVHERDELCMQLEELSEQMVALQSHVMDVENEKQFIEEKYDFLITELDLMKKERAESIGQGVEPEILELQDEQDDSEELDSDEQRDNAVSGDQQRQQPSGEEDNYVDEPRGNDRDAVESKLRELEAIREQLEAERSTLRLQREQQRDGEEKSASADLAAVETESATKIERLTQLNAILQQQLVEKEKQLATLNASVTKEQSWLVRDLEEKLCAMQAGKSDLVTAKEILERDIEALKCDHGADSSQHDQKLEGLSQTNLILQQQLQAKEVELATLKSEMKKQVALSQEEVAAAVQDRDRTAEELRSALEEMETREAELIQRHDIESQNVQAVHKDLVSALEASLREQQEAHDALLEQLQQQQTANASETEKLNRCVLEKEESLASLQSELKSLQEQIHALEQELSDKNEVIVRLETEKQQLVKQIQEIQDQLAQEVEALKHSHESQLMAKQEEFQAQVSESMAFQKAQHDKSLKASAMEVKALLQETRQLKLSLKQKEEEMVQLRITTDVTNAELTAAREEHERVSQQASKSRDLLQYQLSVMEAQLMEIEDKKRSEEDAFDDFAVVDDSSKNSRAWAFIKQKVRELDRFLPQLQSFAYFLDTTLCLCEANTSTLEALSIQNEGGSLTQDIVSFLRFISQLQRGVGTTSHVKQGRRLHRQVLELLTNWYECSENDDVPAPPFGIASREASLVLHNWTADKSKRVAAKRWLARMETVTGQASSEEEANLAIEGSTLELQQMTTEVKQAFLMLIVPILKRNSAIYVRVFTRKALASTGNSSSGSGVEESGEDTSWEMKIHVQLADTLLRRRSSLGALSPQFRSRPPPLKLSNSLPGTTAHVDDHLVATTPTSTQKLQIIQERLQYMQQK